MHAKIRALCFARCVWMAAAGDAIAPRRDRRDFGSPIIIGIVFHHGRAKVWVDWEASVVKAIIPPSPRLSDLIITITYFKVTIIFSNQNIEDIAPMTLSGVVGMFKKTV